MIELYTFASCETCKHKNGEMCEFSDRLIVKCIDMSRDGGACGPKLKLYDPILQTAEYDDDTKKTLKID